MSFVNIGTDGPPNHTLEVEGDVFVSNVEQGTTTNFVPVEIKGDLRLRTRPPTGGSDEYRVTDMKINDNLFGITAPTPDASGGITDFCIDSTGGVGIGVAPTKKLDINGNMYATASLTDESNLITGSLTSAGKLTCSSIFYGQNSNIYGLLPSGAILMTTLTTDPPGWSDVTANFTSNLIMLEDTGSLTTGGNNNFTFTTSIKHYHDWDATHTVSHTHTDNNSGYAINSLGNHTHPAPNTNVNVGSDGAHEHLTNNRVYSEGNRGSTISTTGSTQKPNAMRRPGILPGYRITDTENASHGHNGGVYNFLDSNIYHNHSSPIMNNDVTYTGGGHTHNFSSSGSQTSISILPSCYTLRFIKKN